MKRILSFVLILLCLSFCGCAAVDKIADVELPPVPTSQPAGEDNENGEVQINSNTETQHQHIIVNFDKTELQAYDPQQGEELILSFSYETPYIHIPANPAAEESINEYIAMLNESYYTGDDYGVTYDSGCAPGYINMLTMAEDNYNYIMNSTENLDSGYVSFELANHRSLSVQRCDERILSLRYYDYVNLGGVHGSYAYRAYNFDTQSGELITLEELSDDSEAFKAFLKAYMIESVDKDPELQQRMMGFVDVEGMPGVEEALSALVREGSWYFDDKGMLIVSDLYELGSYAAGTMEFYIPYNALKSYLKAEYIPVPVEQNASFAVVPVETMSESSKEIIDMLRLSDDGQAVYLVSEGEAYDVRLARVDYSDRFYETEQLWQCSSMDNCALQLITLIPEGMPELKISYKDAAGEHTLYLSQSGVDGSLILVDDGIEAVG